MTIEGLGKKFQDARLARGLTLDEAARLTKIRPSRLAEIEAGDFSQFPSLAYAKGFLQIYGKFLEVDVTPYLDAFETSREVTVDGYSYLQDQPAPKPRRVRTTRAPAVRRQRTGDRSSPFPILIAVGVIKANIPSRIAFQVASKIDSRVILDENGADRLLGQGDMLYLPPSASRLIRAQGVLVTDEEIRRLVEFVSAQGRPAFDPAMHEKLQAAASSSDEVTEEDEELVEKCLEIIRQEKRASTSLLQRRLRLGYTRAARIVDILEQRGILGPGEGAKPREILVDLDAAV